MAQSQPRSQSRSQLRRAADLARRELNPAWTAVAVVVGGVAIRLLLEGTATTALAATIVAYAAVVVATALVRVRRWPGIWFCWVGFALHFAWLFAGTGKGLLALVLLLAAGVLAVAGVQDARGVLER